MGEDIASRESRILDLAYRDPLTGLPNRALFAERLESALADHAGERIGRRAADGPRSFQVRQRHARSRDRRHAAARGGQRLREARQALRLYRRAARRRRVRDPASRRMRQRRAARCGRAAARAGGADDARRPCRRRAREPGHRRLSRARARELDAHAPGGHRDVRGQAQQPRHHRSGTNGTTSTATSGSVADERSAQGGRRQRVVARVSAESVARRRQRHYVEALRALASSDARRRRRRAISFRSRNRRATSARSRNGCWRTPSASAPRGAAKDCHQRVDQPVGARRDGRHPARPRVGAAARRTTARRSGSRSRSPRARSSTTRATRWRT